MKIIWCVVIDICGKTDRVFCHFGPNFALGLQKIKIWKKWKKRLKILSFYTCIPQIIWWSYDVWILRYGARQTCFLILDHFLPFYPTNNSENQNFEKNEQKKTKKTKNTWRHHHFTQVYHKWQLYHAWFMRYEAQQTKFFVTFCQFFSHFLPYNPTNNPKKQILKKWKKASGDIIILHKWTKNHDHMLYCFWDIVRNGCNCYFSFWAIFALLPP